ncbi:MAG: hypothetical protein NWF04_09790 [Candidatus Bathyarchaeota archaeon]|nr:hypothetical protein [Candidatus Bathyarchaeota archaeon]
MNKLVSKNLSLVFLFVALAALLVCALPCVAVAGLDDSPAEVDEVLVFLNDVVGLDMEKYEATLKTSFIQNYSDIAFIGDVGYVETSGKYTLQYWDVKEESYSLIDADFTFADDKLVSCRLKLRSGEPLYAKPLAVDLPDAASTFLDRYETFTADANLLDMQNMLDGIEAKTNKTTTSDNLQLDIAVTDSSTSFSWNPFFNGVTYPGLILNFEDNMFKSFGDNRYTYEIGDPTVNVQEKQAIETALNCAAEYSYMYDGKEVTDFEIVEKQILSELRTQSRYAVNDLYPFWAIYLPLADMYPGFVSVLRVEIWANNGEVITCQALSYGGPIPDNSTSDPSASTAPSPTSNQTSAPVPYAVYIAAVVALLAIPIALIAFVLKKKSR